MIINLTQHAASPEQLAAGVRDIPEALRPRLAELLTFVELPSSTLLLQRAAAIAALVDEIEIEGNGYIQAAMIGGAPYLMPFLERELHLARVEPIYAFSRRESVEETLPDGSIRKSAIFKHLGFVRPYA
jgi:hypothetical protein